MSAGLWGAREGPTWGTPHSAQQRSRRYGSGHWAAQPPIQPGGGWLSGDPIRAAVTEALQAPGKIPGCSGTRNLHDNLSDLRAQVAANQKGIQLVGELIGQYGLDVVQAYMGHIQVGLGRGSRGQLCTCPLAARRGGGQPPPTWKAAWPPLNVLSARRTRSWLCEICCGPSEPPGRPEACPWRCQQRTTWMMVPPSGSACRST